MFRQNYFQSYCLRSRVCVCGGGGQGYSNMKLVYICRALFKNGGIKERPLTENVGRGAVFRAAPHGKIRGFGS